MDPARWDRIQTLFHQTVDRPPEEQRTLLERACQDDPSLVPDVMAMLAAETSTSFLDRQIATVAGDLIGGNTPLPFDPAAFLPYRIEAPLGEGGMGVVFLASREDLGNQVAIKILRDGWLSPKRRDRFLEEQRTLARLTHPGIARLYDAQTLPDGTPWFVMEYVDGQPITDYCRQRSVSVEDRLRLFRSVSEAVEYAHQHGVIHRDLKPSNIFVKADGTVRLLDFGIAKQIDPADAMDQARTTLPLMTPAYAAPEQLRGEPAGIPTEIFSLGVILYELLADRLPFGLPRATHGGDGKPSTHVITKPSSVARDHQGPDPTGGAGSAAWADLDLLCLTAIHDDPVHRYPSVAALIRDIDHFLARRPLEARPDAYGYRISRFVRRNGRAMAAAVLLVIAGGALAVLLTSVTSRKASPGPRPDRTVAVLPFRSTGIDSSLDYLKLALPDEIATSLDHAHGLAVRSFASTTKYSEENPDLRRIGREIRARTIVTGGVHQRSSGLLVVLEASDAETGQSLWRDSIDVASQNLIELRAEAAKRTTAALARTLETGAVPGVPATEPKNAEAYALYLRGVARRYDPGPRNEEAIGFLQRAVALDPTYAPGWLALSRRYYVKSRFETGDPALMDSSIAAAERALALDPDYVIAGARVAGARLERGQPTVAYRLLEALIRRRPDSPEAHFVMSYVLRHAGLFDESARHCASALSLDPQNSGWRSCAVALMAQGDYQSAQGYLDLDAGSEFSKALSIHMLVRAGKEAEALKLGPPQMPSWTSYTMLLSCLAGRPETEIEAAAATVTPSDDPESNYFAAAHLSYCGRTTQALALLTRAIEAKYCSYPLMESDPLLERLRKDPGYSAVRAAGRACQEAFLSDRRATS